MFFVKVQKTGNYQFGSQNREGSREIPGLAAGGVSCNSTLFLSGELVKECLERDQAGIDRQQDAQNAPDPGCHGTT